jgi:hypothetical protein
MIDPVGISCRRLSQRKNGPRHPGKLPQPSLTKTMSRTPAGFRRNDEPLGRARFPQTARAGRQSQRHVQITSSELSSPDSARSVNRRATR